MVIFHSFLYVYQKVPHSKIFTIVAGEEILHQLMGKIP